MPKKADAKVDAILRRAQREEDRTKANRIDRIKRAIAGSTLYDHELAAIENVIFAAYGRTKLG
jgi:hypothetical protein